MSSKSLRDDPECSKREGNDVQKVDFPKTRDFLQHWKSLESREGVLGTLAIPDLIDSLPVASDCSRPARMPLPDLDGRDPPRGVSFPSESKESQDLSKMDTSSIISAETPSWLSTNIFRRQNNNKNDYSLVDSEESDQVIDFERLGDDVEFSESGVVMQPFEIIDDADPDILKSSSVEEKQRHDSALHRQSWKDLIMAWLSVSLALIAGASIGPVFKYMSQQGIRPCLSASWRCQCMSIFLGPLALAEAFYDKKNKVDWFMKKPDLPFPVIVHILFSGLAWAGNLLSWIVGLQYTTTFMASVLACSHPLLLVVWLRLSGTPISSLEYIGVVVSFSGMVVSCLQDLLHPSHREGLKIDFHHQLLGYFFCLMAAVFEVIVLFNRIKTKKYVPLMQYTFATTLIVVVCATIASLVLEGNGFIYTPEVKDGSTAVLLFCTQDNCVFGWLSRRWVWKILVFGLWVGVFCIAGFNYAMQYIAPLVFSALSLMDPALTAIISWLAGVEPLPMAFSWIGGTIVMTGIGLISFAEKKH